MLIEKNTKMQRHNREMKTYFYFKSNWEYEISPISIFGGKKETEAV